VDVLHISCEEELAVMRLPSKPLLFEHVLKPLADRSDEFVASVLAKARELNVPFVKDQWDEKKMIRPFVRNERGVQVFRQWLRIPRVREYLVELPRVVAKIQLSSFSWPTLAHALAQNDRPELLEALFEAFPVYRDCKVRRLE
jgi:hypothetical protein